MPNRDADAPRPPASGEDGGRPDQLCSVRLSTAEAPPSPKVRLVMRSAWLKWARGVEHQKALAAETRQRDHLGGYQFDRTDNLNDPTDPLVRMHWRLRIVEPYPERWGV